MVRDKFSFKLKCQVVQHFAGCLFGCICNLFAGSRLATVIGTEFPETVALPEFPAIDDSWRINPSSSADTSFASESDEHTSWSAADESVAESADRVWSSLGKVADVRAAANLSTPQRSLNVVGARKRRRKNPAGTRNESSTPIGATEPSVSAPHKRRRSKNRLFDSGNYIGYDSLSMAEQSELDTSESVNHSSRLKRRRLKSDDDDWVQNCKPAAQKRRRRSSTVKSQKTLSVNVPSDTTQLKVPPLKIAKVVANSIRMTGNSADSGSPVRAQLRLQNMSTGKCYILQSVLKVSFFLIYTVTYSGVYYSCTV